MEVHTHTEQREKACHSIISAGKISNIQQTERITTKNHFDCFVEYFENMDNLQLTSHRNHYTIYRWHELVLQHEIITQNLLNKSPKNQAFK